MSTGMILLSHALCPYVQRVAIVLAEKGVAFTRHDIDLANKPAWFLDISPMGKTPLLLVGDEPIFESSVICEYLDDTQEPRLHPQPALLRAQHRAWMEFGSGVLNSIAGFYSAETAPALEAKARELKAKFGQLEDTLDGGTYFMGAQFSMVDAVFAPIFRYFDLFDAIGDFGVFAATPKVSAWRAQLARRPSVQLAVGADYVALLEQFLRSKHSALAARMNGTVLA
jgi:glutathione S-transferase